MSSERTIFIEEIQSLRSHMEEYEERSAQLMKECEERSAKLMKEYEERNAKNEDQIQSLEKELIKLKSASGGFGGDEKLSKGELLAVEGWKEEKEEDEPYENPNDIYTLMYFSPVLSTSFVYGFAISFLQIFILGLITKDLLVDDLPEGEDDGNSFNVPVTVSTTVRMAQVIAMTIAVASRDDVTDTIDVLAAGHKPGIKEHFPGAVKSKFYIANLLRLLQGSFVIYVSFIFIVQADNVLDLFLNFAAIEFVASLDNLAWDLAEAGWVLTSIQETIESIQGADLKVTAEDRARMIQLPGWAKNTILLAVIGGLFLGWVFIVHIQTYGSLLEATSCGYIQIQFGDDVFPIRESDFTAFETYSVPSNFTYLYNVTRLVGSQRALGPKFDTKNPPDLTYASFSGNYLAYYGDDLVNLRPIYYERSFPDPTSGKFYYCDAEKAWVFTIEALAATDAIPKETKSRCGDDGWLMRSPQTEVYSLDEAPTEGWKIWTGALSEAQDFSFTCAECNSDVDCGVTNGVCNDDDRCDCHIGFEGNFCDHEEPCHELVLYYQKGEPYLVTAPIGNPKAYDRSVYHSSNDDEYILDEFILYDGRRWFDAFFEFAEIQVFFDAAPGQEGMDDYDILSLVFHSYWSGLLRDNVKYFSEPTTSVAPTGPMNWYEIAFTKSVGEDYGSFGVTTDFLQQLECVSVKCSIDRICGLDGTCRLGVENMTFGSGALLTNYTGNQCSCEGNVTGHFCQFSNVVATDEYGKVLDVRDIDPYGGACSYNRYGPLVDKIDDCLEVLYGDFWRYP